MPDLERMMQSIFEPILQKQFEADVEELNRSLLEIEAITGHNPELRKELEELKKDPIGYANSR